LIRFEPPPPQDRPFVESIYFATQRDNRAMRLRSHVVLNGDLASAFGANGTPMAILLDADGRVASGIAAGAQAIFALIDGTAS